jgi:acyl-CoA thioester hydrolase
MVRRGVHHAFRFRTSVWQADVDAFGELRSAVLLRFLQETATRASTAAGFDPAFYERHGTLWLVRRTTLTQLAPIRYGDDLEATTWIADFRRVRSRRDYEVHAGDGLVARASTDWVYVDRASVRPRRIPIELQAAFGLEGAEPLARLPFPAGVPPAHAARSTRRIELHDLDALRHVNNATYAHYIEQAAHDADTAVGWPLAVQLAAGGRFRTVAHDLEYLDAAVYGDELVIVTWPRTVVADAVERHTLLFRGSAERPLLHAVSRYAWADEAGVSRPLPAGLHAVLCAGAA